MEENITILPCPRARIVGSAARFIRTMPRKLVSSTRRYSSGEVSSQEPSTSSPAQCTRASTRGAIASAA